MTPHLAPTRAAPALFLKFCTQSRSSYMRSSSRLLTKIIPRHTTLHALTGQNSPPWKPLGPSQLLARHLSCSSLARPKKHTIIPAPRQRKLHRTQNYKTSPGTRFSSSPTFSPIVTSRNTFTMAALTGVEASKRLAAYRAVEDHFEESYKYVGIGSGSTVVYVVEAIAAKGREITNKMIFVPTGDQSKQLIIEAGLPLGSIDSLPPVKVGESITKFGGVTALNVATGLQDLGLKGKRQSLDVAFDGADEIDDDLNLIKGGGACLFQEKLVAIAAKKFVCVADYRKLQPRLLTGWKAIPIEIAPLAATAIKRILITLGSPDPKIRQGGSAKAGPVVTDNGMWIMDAPFPPLVLESDLKAGDKGDGEHGTWEVHALGRRLKSIVGVLEVGLFYGRNGIQVAASGEEGGGQKPVAAYFGMADGSVEVRTAKELHGVKS